MNKVLLALISVIIFCASIFMSPGCANIIPPGGGLRDSLPPVLVSVTPPDSVKNFDGKRISFTFNEYVQLTNIQQNLLVSPTLPTSPQITAKLRTVTVQIRDTLDENTTYTLNFGNALRDINEGNPYNNFSYIFSTGSYLDSLSFSGKVVLAETGGIDSTLVVILHTSQVDSAVIKERPRYVTRLDREGNFRFTNLPPDTFAIYALKDESGQRRYSSKDQLFAFADTAVIVDQEVAPLTLFAYAEPVAPGTGVTRTTAAPARQTNQQDRRLRITTNLSDGQLSLLENLKLQFAGAPIRRFDSTLASLTNESFEALEGEVWERDTSNTMVTLKYPWTENTAYNLILDKEFGEDTLGNKLLRADTISFRTRRESDYGAIRIRFMNLDLRKNPLLLLVRDNQVQYTHVFTNREFINSRFQPGEYEMRIVYDENKNGKWDPGQFFETRRQPEKVLPISRRLNVKANWDNEIDIELE